MINEISLRFECQEDKDFLARLYLESRDYELVNINEQDSLFKMFMHSQFQLQSKHFEQTFPDLVRQIILCKGEAVGRLYKTFSRERDRLHIVDITVLRAFRKSGIGTRLITELQRSLTPDCPILSLHVVAQNPARYFYSRLGFEQKSQKQNHIYMEYSFSK